jgi:membrane-bound inhibitor of C-type lysozyme
MIRRLLPLLLLAACSPTPKAAETPADSIAAAAATAPTAPTQSPHTTQQAAPAAGVGVAAAFTCDDSVSVLALFRNDSTGKAEVALVVNEDRYHLPQLVSADGAKYGDAKATFWTKGDAAEFTRAGKKIGCRVMQ